MIDLTKFKSLEPVSNLEEILSIRAKAGSSETAFYKSEDDKLALVKSNTKSVMSAQIKEITLEQARGQASAMDIAWDKTYENEDETPRVIPVWASDERVDRHGDIVEQSWDHSEYNTNPILLYSHDWYAMPLGLSIRHVVVQRDDASLGYRGPALNQWMLFAGPDAGPCGEFADTVYRWMKLGILNTVSAGFYPGRTIRVQDPEERAQLGIPDWGLIFQNNKQIELSPCSVPANPGARVVRNLVALRSSSMLKENDIQVLREMSRLEIRRGRKDSATWSMVDEELRAFWQTLGFRNFPKHTDLDASLFLQEIERLSAKPKTPEVVKAAPAANDIEGRLGRLEDKVRAVSDSFERFISAFEQKSVTPTETDTVANIYQQATDSVARIVGILPSGDNHA